MMTLEKRIFNQVEIEYFYLWQSYDTCNLDFTWSFITDYMIQPSTFVTRKLYHVKTYHKTIHTFTSRFIIYYENSF